jgi:hypothetical protein
LSALLGVSSGSSTRVGSVDVLASLRTAGATLTKIGVDSVRETPTTHWRVNIDGVTTTTAPARCTTWPSGFDGMKVSVPQIELWTDSRDRMRRIVVTTTTTFKTGAGSILPQSGFATTPLRDTTVTQTTTTELFDFGVDVHVEEPAPDQVYDVTAPLGALLSGPGTVAPAAWRDIAHGSLRGEVWTLWFARTSTRWRCYQLEGISPLDLPPFPLANPFPKHDGHASECAPSPGGVFENSPFTTIVNGLVADPPFLVGRVSESANDARLVFSDGTSTALPIDPDTRIVQWIGPQLPTPVKIDAGGRACSIDELSNDACQGGEFG